MYRINRRGALAFAGGMFLAASYPSAAQDGAYRIGYALSITGQNAAGVGTSTLPNYRLWVHTVNEAGGLRLPDGTRLKVEVIEYDDRSSAEEAVRAVERLALQDRVDFILPPWGNAFNLAVAPLMHRLGYPQLAASAPTGRADEFVERWDTSYWLIGGGGDYALGLVDILTQAKEAGQINERIAVVSIADGLGIDMINAARPALTAAGFNLVYDRSYPIGTTDFAVLISEAQHSGADTFIAFSLPPESFGLTNQARTTGYNPKIFYIGVGGAFPAFPTIVGNAEEGIFSFGGIDGSSEKIRDYFERHQAFIGAPPDAGSSSITYSSLEMLQQAIERVGTDRAAIARELSNGEFDTIIGTIRLENNQNRTLWLTGQWQDGQFVGVGPRDREGAKPPRIPKPEWN